MSSCSREQDHIRVPNDEARVNGYLSEIFCSIQGEGLFVGKKMIFLRTAGCTTCCSYCDTGYSQKQTPQCVIFAREKRAVPNPIGVDEVVREVFDIARDSAPVRTVSITGGEPLEQSRFVASAAAVLKQSCMEVYLETNGIEVDGLAKVLPFVDVISMDIKLPSAIGCSRWSEHREFLRQATQAGGDKTVFAKVVIGDHTPASEVEMAVDLISGVGRNIPLVLQPESKVFSGRNTSTNNKNALKHLLVECQKLALERLSDVRVIPQWHKIMGVM
ncbi:MAG: radical SAM protein [Candidatus Latescibacteria bacterium]|nr:radical SAM protein [Candidatus Latescibacterota bacterium]NIM66450.1 radical SAM protein [Candidatus Latescibacterota bacterium]NIO02930.1 radical SAM protein [Candidatus Latescibacterota bacterium]NIO30065.1 radical SAM protein [Candidatus Latescibacterota bacterium]NIO57680.1 radical SAM protein [Candidatus Latescibacterota bacterium]